MERYPGCPYDPDKADETEVDLERYSHFLDYMDMQMAGSVPHQQQQQSYTMIGQQLQQRGQPIGYVSPTDLQSPAGSSGSMEISTTASSAIGLLSNGMHGLDPIEEMNYVRPESTRLHHPRVKYGNPEYAMDSAPWISVPQVIIHGHHYTQSYDAAVPAPQQQPIETTSFAHPSITVPQSNEPEKKQQPTTAMVKGKDRVKKTKEPRSIKVSHNMIEKRYRMRLNEKIRDLRDSIPGLSKTNNEEEEADEDSDKLAKLNKATIMVKAKEYINHLEHRNREIFRENQQLHVLLQQAGLSLHTPHSLTASTAASSLSLEDTAPSAKQLKKLAAASIGAVLVYSSSPATETSSSSHGELGIFPVWSFGSVFKFTYTFALLGIVGALVLHRLFKRHQKRRQSLLQSTTIITNEETTEEKSFDATYHTLFPNSTRLQDLRLRTYVLEIAQLGLRALIGSSGYGIVTGTKGVRELVRISAWSRVVDRQLRGADRLVSTPRLVLTFLESLSLPATTARLMQNAMFAWLLPLPMKMRVRLSNAYWHRAQIASGLHGRDAGVAKGHISRHLKHLVAMPSQTVFSLDVVHALVYQARRQQRHIKSHDALDMLADQYASSQLNLAVANALASHLNICRFHLRKAEAVVVDDAILAKILACRLLTESKGNRPAILTHLTDLLRPMPNTITKSETRSVLLAIRGCLVISTLDLNCRCDMRRRLDLILPGFVNFLPPRTQQLQQLDLFTISLVFRRLAQLNMARPGPTLSPLLKQCKYWIV